MCAEGCFEYCPTDGFQVSGAKDNWPLGWGALVNQQTMHRGAAHVDPDGPHRVLFIVTFAPRPRFGRGQVETRMIGQGGSYSLHWTHWGHTLNDYRDASRYMRQPWRTLRSMGVYKPRGRNWGWDWVSQSSARIANNELGFYYTDLVNMIKNGGLPGVPLSLHGDIPPEPYDGSSRTVWVKFYSDTLKLCRRALLRTHLMAVLSYLILVVGGTAFFFSNRPARSVVSRLSRLIGGHVLVLSLAWYGTTYTQNSDWVKNIRAGRIYRWRDLPRSLAPALDSTTLPTRDDILVFDDMQSAYLASFNEVLDVFHPGNRAWNAMVADNYVGYESLTPALQTQLCESMLRWAHRDGRRLLVKNVVGQWARVDSDDGLALRFCHKEMMKRSSPTIRIAIRQLDFQMTECVFGYLRNSSMHNNYIHVPRRLQELQDQVMKFSGRSGAVDHVDGLRPRQAHKDKALQPNAFFRSLIPFPAGSRESFLPSRFNSVLPPQPEIDTTKWIEEGDDVDAAYEELMTGIYHASFL